MDFCLACFGRLGESKVCQSTCCQARQAPGQSGMAYHCYCHVTPGQDCIMLARLKKAAKPIQQTVGQFGWASRAGMDPEMASSTQMVLSRRAQFYSTSCLGSELGKRWFRSRPGNKVRTVDRRMKMLHGTQTQTQTQTQTHTHTHTHTSTCLTAGGPYFSSSGGTGCPASRSTCR